MVDHVAFPTGRRTTREVVLHPGSVAVIPILPNNSILLVKQYRHAVREVLWEIPAGKIEPGEIGLETAKRELREETGYETDSWRDILSFYSSPGFTNEKLWLFVAKDVHQITKPDECEIEQIKAFKLPHMISMASSGGIVDGKTLLALAWWMTIDN